LRYGTPPRFFIHNQLAVRQLVQRPEGRKAAVHLHSGLRIFDAAKLRPEKVVNGKLLLYTAKTGVPVWCPLPPDLLLDLSKPPLVGKFFFAVRSKNPVTIAEYYRVKLEKAAIAAGLAEKRTKGELRRRNEIHPQRLRDTFSSVSSKKAFRLNKLRRFAAIASASASGTMPRGFSFAKRLRERRTRVQLQSVANSQRRELLEGSLAQITTVERLLMSQRPIDTSLLEIPKSAELRRIRR
jgi:hypothetical protein